MSTITYTEVPGDATSSLLAATLFFIHVSRRLYESLRVTIYSGAQMNLVHYVAGFTHYWGCTTVLLTYSPGFTNQGLQSLSVDKDSSSFSSRSK